MGMKPLAQQMQDTGFSFSKTILFLYAVLGKLRSPDVFLLSSNALSTLPS